LTEIATGAAHIVCGPGDLAEETPCPKVAQAVRTFLEQRQQRKARTASVSPAL